MMQQYQELKARYPGALLMFRLGDFYEMFFDDAQVASRELEIGLTSRGMRRVRGGPGYLAAGIGADGAWGLAAADLSTGDFQVPQLGGPEAARRATDELSRLDPREVLTPDEEVP